MVIRKNIDFIRGTHCGGFREILHFFPGNTKIIKPKRGQIDNNQLENAIRPFALGRKNWLFMGSPSGAKAGSVFYSLIETCKANDIEPYKYLCSMLNRIRDCVTEDDYRQLLPPFITL